MVDKREPNRSSLGLYPEIAFFVMQVKKIMFYRTLTLTDMAKLVGVSVATISRMLKDSNCSAYTMKKILNGLKLNMDDILRFCLPGEHRK
jgi:DNA-binding Xre family transcriptional regulator